MPVSQQPLTKQEEEMLLDLQRTLEAAILRRDKTILPHEVKQLLERWGTL